MERENIRVCPISPLNSFMLCRDEIFQLLSWIQLFILSIIIFSQLNLYFLCHESEILHCLSAIYIISAKILISLLLPPLLICSSAWNQNCWLALKIFLFSKRLLSLYLLQSLQLSYIFIKPIFFIISFSFYFLYFHATLHPCIFSTSDCFSTSSGKFCRFWIE